MGVFHQEEPPTPSKKCKLFATGLKDAFTSCHRFGGRDSDPSLEDDSISSDFDDEEEEVVSTIRIRAMEKLRRKPSLVMDSCYWVFPPSLQELYMSSLEIPIRRKEDQEEDEAEEFVTVNSCLSCCSSAVSRDTFFSVRTSLSRSSSLNRLDFSDLLHKRLIFQELCHCEGWPFGLCRKAVLLPPLPKSPSESWTWRKHTRIVKLPYL